MDSLRMNEVPDLHQPILVAAFEGWNDAGEAATIAMSHLIAVWDTVTFADIDPEEFYDFTATRPLVQREAGDRHLVWPANTFQWTRPVGSPDVILMLGVEPQLRWRTFCDQVLEVAERTGARLVLTLGALIGDVVHSRPTSVFGTAYDPVVAEALQFDESRYEGPTGIVGALHDRCREKGINSASLWAAIPSYVPAAPSPKAALALVERIGALLKTEIDVPDLETDAATYESQISELVAEDDETEAFVAHLEEMYDQAQVADDSAEALVTEVERFLKDLQ